MESSETTTYILQLYYNGEWEERFVYSEDDKLLAINSAKYHRDFGISEDARVIKRVCKCISEEIVDLT